MNPATLLCIYAFLICIIPIGVGFHLWIDFTSWIILAIIFLFPSFLRLISKKGHQDELNVLMMIYIIILAVPSFLMNGIKPGFGIIEKNFLYIFLPFFAGRYYIKNEKDLLRFFYALTLVSIAVSVMVFSEFYSGEKLIHYPEYLLINVDADWANSIMVHSRAYFVGASRAVASFLHPIWLGEFLFLVILISMMMFVYRRVGRNKFLMLVIVIQVVFGLIAGLMSQSRTAMLSFIIIIALFMIFGRKSNVKKYLTIIALTAISFISLFYVFHLEDFFNQFIFHNFQAVYATDNLYGRKDIIIGSFNCIFNYFNFIGEGCYIYLPLRKFLSSHDNTNGFLAMFLYNGAVCGFLHIYFWFKGFKESYKLSKHSSYGTILFCLLAYMFIVHNVSVMRYQVLILFYIILGITYNPYVRKLRDFEKNDVRSYVWVTISKPVHVASSTKLSRT